MLLPSFSANLPRNEKDVQRTKEATGFPERADRATFGGSWRGGKQEPEQEQEGECWSCQRARTYYHTGFVTRQKREWEDFDDCD